MHYTVSGTLRTITHCHCVQCRKNSGHFWAATSASNDRITITGEDALVWYRSSETVQRGFCGRCGSSLFYRPDGQDRTAIGAGTLDGPTGLRAVKHIYMQSKGDYYDIDDGLPQFPQWEDPA